MRAWHLKNCKQTRNRMKIMHDKVSKFISFNSIGLISPWGIHVYTKLYDEHSYNMHTTCIQQYTNSTSTIRTYIVDYCVEGFPNI